MDLGFPFAFEVHEQLDQGDPNTFNAVPDLLAANLFGCESILFSHWTSVLLVLGWNPIHVLVQRLLLPAGSAAA